jgi:hypothetical protein
LAHQCPLRHFFPPALTYNFTWFKRPGTVLQPMGSKGWYLKKFLKLCWPIRITETSTKYTPLILLSHSRLTWKSRNILFAL